MYIKHKGAPRRCSFFVIYIIFTKAKNTELTFKLTFCLSCYYCFYESRSQFLYMFSLSLLSVMFYINLFQLYFYNYFYLRTKYTLFDEYTGLKISYCFIMECSLVEKHKNILCKGIKTKLCTLIG